MEINNTSPETPVSAVPSLETYEGIKHARKNKIMPTQEQFEKALLAQRQKVADLAVAAAVASGEQHTQARLPFPVETQGVKPYELSNQAAKASRHLSKLVYWFAKFEAGKFHELHLPPVSSSSPYGAAPDDDYDPSNDEESDEESDEDGY